MRLIVDQKGRVIIEGVNNTLRLCYKLESPMPGSFQPSIDLNVSLLADELFAISSILKESALNLKHEMLLSRSSITIEELRKKRRGMLSLVSKIKRFNSNLETAR